MAQITKLTFRLGWIILKYIIYNFKVISTGNYPLYLEYIVAYVILKVNRISEYMNTMNISEFKWIDLLNTERGP